MNQALQHYMLIAGIFRYPDASLDKMLEEIGKLVWKEYPESSATFQQFYDAICCLNEKEREEYFVRTFEVEALCCMDIGYVLFGEDYKRGDFLAKIQREQNLAGNDLGAELADHLPNLLTLMPLMEDKELATELGYSLILPALAEIGKRLEGGDNFYQFGFQFLQAMMEKDFRDLPYEQLVIRTKETELVDPGYACGADFLETIGKRQF